MNEAIPSLTLLFAFGIMCALFATYLLRNFLPRGPAPWLLGLFIYWFLDLGASSAAGVRLDTLAIGHP